MNTNNTIFTCPVCGKRCSSLTELSNCVSYHKKTQEDNERIRRELEARAKTQDLRQKIGVLRKDIENMSLVMKDKIKDYRKLISEHNQISPDVKYKEPTYLCALPVETLLKATSFPDQRKWGDFEFSSCAYKPSTSGKSPLASYFDEF